MNWLFRVVLGKALDLFDKLALGEHTSRTQADLATVPTGTLPGQEGQGTMPGSFELPMRHGELPN